MVMQGRRARRDEDGFGLVDCLLSLTVLLVVLIATSYLVDNVVRQAATSREKVAATELAEQWLEQLSNAPISSLQAYIGKDVQLTSQPVVVGNIAFTVWGHLEWADTGAAKSLCNSGNPPQVIRATITVTWRGQSLGETTIINPPYGTVVPGDGFLSIQIQGLTPPKPPADTANLTNVVVTVTPQSGSASTYNPDGFGCVYLLEPLGTYSVSVASPAGGPTFIDWQENLTPSQPNVQVTVAGLPAFVPAFHYDEAGTVAFSPSSSAPVAGGMPISVSNGGNLQPSGTAVVVAAGASATSATLFPYSSAYSVWYGDCTTVGSKPTIEEPASPATVNVTPKGNTSVSITGLDVLAITATRSAGNFIAAPTATATVADPTAPADGCPAVDNSGGEVYVLAGFSGATNTYTSQTAVMPQTYTVKVTANGSTTPFSMVIGTSGVTYSGTTYPYGTPVPVTVP